MSLSAKLINHTEFSLRLVDFDTEYFHTGHVQIYHSGKWGYICGTNWDNRDGAVACSQLGFEGFQQITLQSYHSNASGMAWTDNVNCHESDLSFAECGIVFDNTSNCSGNLAGVKCVTLGKNIVGIQYNLLSRTRLIRTLFQSPSKPF